MEPVPGINNLQNLEMQKSGLELWRLLKYNFDRASAFDVKSVLESIRPVQATKNIQDVMSKVKPSKDDIRRVKGTRVREDKTHDISDFPEVFRKADLVKVLPDVIVKELKMSTNIDFEKDSHSEIRDMVTTIVCNHMNAASPVDVDAHIMSIEKEKSHRESEEYEDKAVEAHDNGEHLYQDEEGGPICYMGESSEGGWQTTGKSKGKGKPTEHATTAGRRVIDAETSGEKGAKANGNRMEMEDTPRASTDTKAASS